MNLKHTKIAVVDLDGCLFDDDWRLSLIDGWGLGDEGFARYHNSISGDAPVKHAMEVLIPALIENGYKFIVCTARPEKYRSVTHDMLSKHYPSMLNHTLTMLMRPNGDITPSPLLKVQLIHDYLKDDVRADDRHSEEVLMRIGVDDRHDVLEEYSKIGFRAVFCGVHSMDEVIMQDLKDSSVVEQVPTTNQAKEIEMSTKIPGQPASMMAPAAPMMAPAAPKPLETGVPVRPSVQDCMDLFNVRDKEYSASRFMTASILAEFGPFDIDGYDAKKMSLAFNGAMVKYTQFVRGYMHDQDTLADFIGCMLQLKETFAQCQKPPMPLRNAALIECPVAALYHVNEKMSGRQNMYGDANSKAARIIDMLLPEGVHIATGEDIMVYHLFEIMTVKIVRFANRKFDHLDSLDDIIVVAAMMLPHIGNHGIGPLQPTPF